MMKVHILFFSILTSPKGLLFLFELKLEFTIVQFYSSSLQKRIVIEVQLMCNINIQYAN
jgi:hypothetical protein